MSNRLLGTPPRTKDFGVRAERGVHRVFLPIIVSALLAPKYVRGTDVSKWNGIMNWQKNFDAGGRFTFARLGSIGKFDGKCYLDYQWETNSEIAPTFMPTGGYFYFRPAWDANLQADFVCEHILGKNLLLPFTLDAENNDTRMIPRYVDKQLHRFVDRMYENVGKFSIIYTSQGFWSFPNILATDGNPRWAAELDLFVANYTLRPSPRIPVTWLTPGWRWWQHSADGNKQGVKYGGERSPGAPEPSIDLDWFNGDQVAFDKYIADYNELEPPPPLPPPFPPPTPPSVTLEAWAKEIDTWAREQGYDGSHLD